MRPHELAAAVRAGTVKDMHERGRGGKHIFMTSGQGDFKTNPKMIVGGSRIMVSEVDYLEFLDHLKKQRPPMPEPVQ